MKHLSHLAIPLLVVPALVSPAPDRADSISFAPTEDSALTKTFVRRIELELT